MLNEEFKDKATANNNSQQLSVLGEQELEAMRMWFEGYSSPEIEKRFAARYGEAGVKAQCIRSWFMTGGKLYKIYREYAQDEARMRREEATDMFRAHLKTAVRELMRLLVESPMDTVRVAAAKEIINRELGETPKMLLPLTKDPVDMLLKKYGILGNENNEESIEQTS